VTEEIDKLVEQIGNNAKPIQRLKITHLLGAWFVFSALIGAYYLDRVGMRSDLGLQTQRTDFMLALLCYVVVFVVSSIATLRLALPGREPRSWRSVIGLCFLFATCAIILYAGVHAWRNESLLEFDGWSALGCCLRISYGAVIPAFVLTGVVTWLAPARLAPLAGLVWFASATLVSIVSQMNCPIDSLGHIVIGHGFMVVGVGVFAWLVFLLLAKAMQQYWFDRRTNFLRKRK
jgi:hypothetical protein